MTPASPVRTRRGVLLPALLLTTAAIWLAAAVIGARSPSDRMEGLPRLILWAWERPENLLFLNPKQTGVAFLAQTLYLRDGTVAVRPRLQPLRVPPGTRLIAVVHIESDWPRSALTVKQMEQAATAVIELGRLPGVGAIQMHFDARQSERDFYRDLLHDVRDRLAPAIKL